MSEIYPPDQTLLGLAQEPHTGVEFIPTGKTPYYLEFRRLVHRLTLAAGRSGDLRPYQDGDLSIGVKSGRCVVDGAVQAFAGEAGLAVSNNDETYVYLDAAGEVQTAAALPDDRATFLPIAQVTAADGEIVELLDLRGEAFLHTPTPRDGTWVYAVYDGELMTSLPDAPVAVIPVSGTIDRVVFTIGSNIVSSVGIDGVEAILTINGTALCTTKPKIVDNDGPGLRSTARGDGVAAILDPSAASVQAGDLLRRSLTLMSMGTISQHPEDIGVALRIMPD